LDTAGRLRISEQIERKEHTIQIFTDGSKKEHGVGSGTAIYIQNKLIDQMKHNSMTDTQLIRQNK